MTAAWWDRRLVGFDLETTGPDPETARIVTACVVVTEPYAEPKAWSWLVNPGIEIPAEATAVHGITNEQAASGQDAAVAIDRIMLTLVGFSDSPVVAFNAAFDFTVLDREARRHGLDPYVPAMVVDPFVLDKQGDRYRRGSRKLVDVAAHYGVPLDDAHTAEADALAAVAVARRIGVQHQPPADARALHAGQIAWRREQCESLQDYFRRKDPAAVVNGDWPVQRLMAEVTS